MVDSSVMDVKKVLKEDAFGGYEIQSFRWWVSLLSIFFHGTFLVIFGYSRQTFCQDSSD